MLKYIVKRILMLIPVLLGATFIVFTVMDMTPGDPAVSKLGVDARKHGAQRPFPAEIRTVYLELGAG